VLLFSDPPLSCYLGLLTKEVRIRADLQPSAPAMPCSAASGADASSFGGFLAIRVVVPQALHSTPKIAQNLRAMVDLG